MKIFNNITIRTNFLNRNLKKETRQANQKPQIEFNPDLNFNSYPIPVFCGRRSLCRQIFEFAEGEIPASAYKLAQEAMMDPHNKDRIYQIHNKAYAPLRNCKTLEEAKELFEEFKDVINISDINKQFKSNNLISRIKNNEIDGINAENAALVFLKKIFCDMIPPSKQEKWFGFNYRSLKKILIELHIKPPSRAYFLAYWNTEPEKNKNIADAAKEYYEKNPDAVKKLHEKREEYAKKHPGNNSNSGFYKKNPKALKVLSLKNKQFYIDHPEAVTIKREQSIRWYDEHGDKMRACYDLAWEIHKEKQQLMKDVAKNEFPLLSEVLKKEKSHTPLTPIERAYRAKYFKRCEELCPNKCKQVGATFTQIWEEQFKGKI